MGTPVVPLQRCCIGQLEVTVRQLMAKGRFISEAEVARWLDRDPSPFNRWVNGFSHPRTDADWRALKRLGVNSGFLRRLELLDKLDAWRDDHGLLGAGAKRPRQV